MKIIQVHRAVNCNFQMNQRMKAGKSVTSAMEDQRWIREIIFFF
jgi:hypothetical protein